MTVKFLFVIFGGIVLTLVDNARILPRVKRQSLKVRITAKDDSIVLQYLSSSPAIKLQGYVLGYGGRHSKQNITLPDNGDPLEVDVEFNPKYLIAVHPVAEQSKATLKKKCKGNLDLHKPPQITIATRTSTSVFLTWTNSFKGKVYKHIGDECADERHYTVRYREKERNKKWLYQCCPTSETLIDNLKPNTVYEFGVRVTKAKEEGVWSKPAKYVTTVTPSPTSTENDQSQKTSKTFAINFNSGNPKNSEKPKQPGKTNIIGLKGQKGLAASNPARNGTNLIQLLPRTPNVNTHVVLGGQSASDSADVHSGSSSSPKPIIPSKPEQTHDQLHGKEDINKIKDKETSNTVTKPSLKNGKIKKSKPKSEMKPLTTKESKLPSSVSPSFPSKPVPKSDPAEIQIPVFLTPSTPSELETMDKQQPTEPETTPSTSLPFGTLFTTSGHTAVDKQHLPGTAAALDAMETQKFSEPEIPSSSSGPFHPTPEPDAVDNQEFTEPEVSSTTSSFSSSSNLASKLDVMDKEQFTAREESSSKASFSHTTSEPDTMDNQQFTEPEIQPTADSFLTTSNKIYEFDSTQRKQISVPEFDVPFSSSSPVSTLKTSKHHALDPKQSKEFKIPSSKSSFIFTSELNVVDNQKFTEPEVSSSTTSKLFITPNPIADVDVKGQQPFTDHELPDTDVSYVFSPPFPSEHDSTTVKEFTDEMLPDSDNPNMLNLIPVSKLYPNIGNKEITDHELPEPDSATRVPDIGNMEEEEFTDYELSVSEIPYVLSPIPVSELPKVGKKEFTADHQVPTPDTRNVFSSISDYELPVTDSPYVFKPIPDSEPVKIREKIVTADHEMPTFDTRDVFSSISDNELPVTDSPYVFKPIPDSEPAKIGKDELADHEVPTPDTRNVFSLLSEYELPVTDTPNVFSSIPQSEPAKIGEKEVAADHEVPTSHTRNVFSSTAGYELPVTDSPYVFKPIPDSEPAKIEKDELTANREVPTPDTRNVFSFISGNELPVTDTPNVFSPIPDSEPANIGEKDVTADHEVPTPDTPNVFSLISEYDLQVSDTPNVFSPVPESEPAKTGEKEAAADQEVPTSDTLNVSTLLSDYELLVTDSPSVFSPIPESEPSKIGKDEVTDHMVPVNDTLNVFSPIPESEPANIGKKKVTDHEVPTSDTPNLFSSISDYELPFTDSPFVFKPIPDSEPTKIGKNKVTDYEVPTSDTRNVFSLISGYELPLTDTPHVFSPILESEPAKIREKEVTADHEVPTSDTPNVFSSISEYQLPVTDTPNVFNPTPESKPAKIGAKEDSEVSTSDTAIVSNPTPVYETREKELTDHKLPASDITHVFIPTSVSELDHIEDKEFTAHKPTKSDTSPKFRSTPISELGSKEDEKFTEHKLPISGTPYMSNQSQQPAFDNIEDKNLTDNGFPTSETPHVRKTSPVQPQFGSTGKKDISESDPLSDSSPITSKPVRKPVTKQKQKFTEPETQSPGSQLFSTVPGSTHESSSVFRSTPVSNIDGQGQERFRGSYVKYMTKPNMPCSITESLKYFPEENITNIKALSTPRYGPSNLTLVTVEGCPTFLIVDWEKNENDTASEYEVLSKMTGLDNKTEELITVTNQTHTAVENLKPNTSYTFLVTPTNIHGRGPSSDSLSFVTESADPSVSEYIPGKDAIWTQYSFKFDSYSECQGRRFVKRTRYRKFVGIILCNSLRYKIYLSNSLSGIFYNIGDLSGHGEDHCQFVDSFLDGRTGEHLLPEQLPIRQGFYRSVRQEPVMFGTIGGRTHINYVHWYECGIAIPGQW
ncbi:uncharacterized protein LOC144691708 isoform X2 [Cetorhinus maximus]